MAEKQDSTSSDDTSTSTSTTLWSWNSWLNAAKSKSTEVFEFVKRDLDEFGSAVKNEASNMVSATSNLIEKTLKLDDAESATSSMKRSFSSFIGQMNTVLNPSPDDSDTEAIIISKDNETVPLTKLQKAVYELQKNPDTFLKDPEPRLNAQYQCWLEIISDQLTADRLEKHLTGSDTLNQQYLTLCPDQVPHDTFWKRYLFKKALLEDSLAHQEALEKREWREKQVSEEHLKWDQEDFASNIELTEEEQIKLLEQYEIETKMKAKEKENVQQTDTNKPSSQKGKKKSKKKTEDVISSKEITTKTETNIKEDHFMVDRNVSNPKVASKTLSQTSLSSESVSAENKSSASSLDGEWECINNDKIY